MKPVLRASAEVGALYGLLGWVYVAAVAAVRPDALAAPIAAGVPLRRDTFGACCFAVSVVGFFATQVSRGAPRRWTRPTRPVDAVLRTVWAYPLLVWAYLCVNSVTHPWTIDRPLTHFAGVPSEGTTAVGCFLGSAVALLAVRVRDHRGTPGRRDG